MNADATSSGLDKFSLSIILLCFAISGFAALLYQAVWIRSFSIVFGTSHLAVAIVLAAYMAGLAIGAIIIRRNANRVRHPLRLYAILELAIGFYAIAFPLLAATAEGLLPILAGTTSGEPQNIGPGQQLYFVVASLLILGPPTIVMGMTLPILAQLVVRTNRQVGPRVAHLYALNTAGAVAGVIVAGFYLIPIIGLRNTMLVGAAANISVAAIASLLSRTSLSEPTLGGEISAQSGSTPIQIWVVLFVMSISGALSFYYELLWTRLLSHVLGGSTYAYATMLAAFLTGIAIGGAVGGWFATDRKKALPFLAVLQLGIGLASAATYRWLQVHEFTEVGLAANAVTAFAVILPGALLIGATYPVAVRYVTLDVRQIISTSARVYAWNTFGGIIGAVAAGFIIIPWLGFASSLQLAVTVNTMLAVALSASLYRRSPQIGIAALLVMVAVLMHSPERPDVLIQSASISEDKPGTEVYYGVGRSATIFVKQIDGYFYLRSDGRPEAAVAPLGAPAWRLNQHWLGAIPAAAHPAARSALIVGFGGGVAIAGLPASVEAIDVIELEEQVISANQAIRSKRQSDPLADPRIRIVINDARSALTLSNKRYDLVISQPSHPWTAGASHLYTAEFARLAHSRLTENGVFLQWINARFIDEKLLRSVAATLHSTFAHVRAYQVEPMVLMFLASDSSLAPEYGLQKLLESDKGNLERMRRFGLASPESLLATWILHDHDIESFATGADTVTDNRNHMAYRSASQGDGLDGRELDRIFAPFDPLQTLIAEDGNMTWNLAYLGRQLMANGEDDRVARLVANTEDIVARNLLLGGALYSRGARAEPAFREVLLRHPENQQANFGFVSNYLQDLAIAAEVPTAIAESYRRLQGSAAAVVVGFGYAIKKDWVALRWLDDELATASSTDLWYPFVVQLRCDWRLRLFGTESDASLLSDTIRIVDESSAIYPSLEILMRRATAAHLLDDNATFIETIAAMTTVIERQLQHVLGSGLDTDLTKLLQDSRRVEALLEEQSDGGSSRFDQVRQRLVELFSRIGSLSGNQD